MNISVTAARDRAERPSPSLPPQPLSPELLDRIRAGASQRDSERILPFELIEELKTRRFGARRVPVDLGGGGVTLAEGLGEAVDLAEADPNVAHIWRNHFMVLERLVIPRPEQSILRQLAADVANGAMISIAATELTRAQTGGTSAFDTVLKRRGDRWVLNGRKFYSTGVMYADVIMVAATDEAGANVSALIPRRRAGIEIIDDWTGMGQRLTGTGTTFFHEVEVHADEILQVIPGQDQSVVLSSTVAQLFLTAAIAGIVAAIARDAVGLLASRSRTFYFAPTELAKDDPILLRELGEREADAFAARAVVLAAAAVADRASVAIAARAPLAEQEALVQEAAAAAARAKIIVDRIAHAAGSAIYDVAGASSTLKEKNLDRHWRNLRTISSHNPASYKAYALGNHRLNGVPLPAYGFF